MSHSEDLARDSYNRVQYETRITERTLAIIKRREKCERICEDTALVARIRKDLGTDESKKLIARRHGVPHHVVMYIWRNNGPRT